jgi:hypothetical protein
VTRALIVLLRDAGTSSDTEAATALRLLGVDPSEAMADRPA